MILSAYEGCEIGEGRLFADPPETFDILKMITFFLPNLLDLEEKRPSKYVLIMEDHEANSTHRI